MAFNYFTDLSYGLLKEINKYKYEDIIRLNISYNNLKELPEWINKCINLQSLRCNSNNILCRGCLCNVLKYNVKL